MVEYWDENGRSLTIGAGLTESAALFQFSLDPPYFASMGASDRDIIEFIAGNEPTEFLGQNIISAAQALECLRDFFDSREKPASIEWEQL